MKKKILLVLLLIITVCSFYNPKEVSAEEYVSNTFFVDIKGEINNPGVYEVESNKRIIDVINLAGGLTDKADTSIINLSKKVKDEMYIVIYSNDQIKEYKQKLLPSKEIIKKVEEKIICPDNSNDGCAKNNTSKEENNITGKININTASKEELMTLTGIGESKADKIIEYRSNNKFNSIEDIKNISGVGDSIFEKIKDNIITE